MRHFDTNYYCRNEKIVNVMNPFLTCLPFFLPSPSPNKHVLVPVKQFKLQIYIYIYIHCLGKKKTTNPTFKLWNGKYTVNILCFLLFIEEIITWDSSARFKVTFTGGIRHSACALSFRNRHTSFPWLSWLMQWFPLQLKFKFPGF